MRIDLHHHLLHNRRNAVRSHFDNPLQRLAFQAWLWAMQTEMRYTVATKLAAMLMRIGLARAALRPWTETREFPELPARTFKDWWRGNHE